jgi:hypothetical protein
MQVKTGNVFYTIPGSLASLWTADTAVSTAVTLGTAGAGTLANVGANVGTKAAQVTLNRQAGNAFRDEIAGLMTQMGYQVRTEVYKRTIFGRRFIDIEVSKGGTVLGGIEAKYGGAVYSGSQRAKDAYLYMMHRYRVNVVRSQ